MENLILWSLTHVRTLAGLGLAFVAGISIVLIKRDGWKAFFN